MRIVTWGERGKERTGLLMGDTVVDLNRADGTLPSEPGDLFRTWDETIGRIRKIGVEDAGVRKKAGMATEYVRLGSPSPAPGEVVCLAGNYEEHIREGECVRDFKRVGHPKLFSKAAVCVSGPRDDIAYPAAVEKLDYEVELGVIMGRFCRKVRAKDALGYVAGYCVLNDVSARCAQFGDQQFLRGKSFETFCPMGPCLVTADEAGDVGRLWLRSWVNGEKRQDSRTDRMTFGVAEIIEFVSHVFPLQGGDVIGTGTPAGVGVFMEPSGLLRVGDVVEMEVEGLGRLRNRVIAGE